MFIFQKLLFFLSVCPSWPQSLHKTELKLTNHKYLYTNIMNTKLERQNDSYKRHFETYSTECGYSKHVSEEGICCFLKLKPK